MEKENIFFCGGGEKKEKEKEEIIWNREIFGQLRNIAHISH